MSVSLRVAEPGVGVLEHVRVLSNGRYAVLLTRAGGGYSARDGFALTRWTPDPIGGTGGFYVYVRDLDDGPFWSVAPEPVRATHDRLQPLRLPGGVGWVREMADVESRIEVRLAADRDVELRRITLRNAGTRSRRLELTTYAEVVLDHPAATVAHPAFSKLFVETAALPDAEALLAWRRPRSPDDRPLWLVHTLLLEDAAASASPLGWETDRARFLGRGRAPALPAALACVTPLSGTVGNVLDPIFAMRRAVTIEPGAAVSLVAVLCAGDARGDVIALVRAARDADGRAQLWDAPAAPSADAADALGLPASWRRAIDAGVSGDAAAGDAGDGAGGWAADAAATAPRDEDARGGQRAPSHDARASSHELSQPAGRRPAGEVADDASHSKSDDGVASAPGAASDLRCFNGHGGFTRDGREYVIRIARGATDHALPPQPWVNVIANDEVGVIVSERGALHTWAANSRENRLTPWSNDPVTDPHGEALYVRDDESGVFWSPTPGPAPADAPYEVRHGFGYTRYALAAHDLDHDVCVFVPHDAPVRIARVAIRNDGAAARRLSLFAYAQLVLGGTPADTRGRLETRADDGGRTLYATNADRGEFSERVAFAAVAPAADAPDAVVHATTDRGSFIGVGGDLARPAAVAAGACDGAVATGADDGEPGVVATAHDTAHNDASARASHSTTTSDVLDGTTGAGLDACFALQHTVTVAPGETAVCAFLLGEAASADAAAAVVDRFRTLGAVDAAYDDAVSAWRELLGAVQIATPSPALDFMVNGWLPYQNLSCRMRGRTAFYQSGGAFGFRDQLQDSSALLYLDPAITRRQILLHAAHQFVEGDVLHWWHPPTSKGIRTRFSDDLLWLPYITSFYVGATGDAAVLDEPVGFVTSRELEPGEDEALLVPERAEEVASVYAHCCRALDRSLTRGAHGLPLIGVGDWNDGMNRVGREGRGESVWLGFFLYRILGDFIPVCEQKGDDERAQRYRAYHTELHAALDDAGWDGGWYRRAYYDDGAPIGSADSDECRIDAIAQAWSVLSGAAPPDKARRVLDALEKHLVDEDAGLIRLLTPAFDRTPHDPGYIKGYPPGVRENGGQYTHGVLWAVRAFAQAGRRHRAARLLEMLSPVSHTQTPHDVAVYRTEPYVVAADVYGEPPHVGRGGWTWYTGSAGWMVRVALESILGFELRAGTTIALKPCIPDEWPGFQIRWRVPGEKTGYTIDVARAAAGDPASAHMDDEPLAIENGAVTIPLARDGLAHHVSVRLTEEIGPHYRPNPPAVPSPSSGAAPTGGAP